MKYQYMLREGIFKLIGKGLPLYMPVLYFYSNYWARKIEKLETPLVLAFFITNRCNLRCKHCFYWRELTSKNENGLSTKQIKKIADSLNKLDTLLITGGEGFLREDIVDICTIFKNKTKKLNIATNGTNPGGIKNKVENILSKTSLDLNVQVSLDGLEATHDKIRGKFGVFKDTVRTIPLLKQLQGEYRNFHVTILTTVSKDNIKEIEQLLDFSEKNLGVYHGFQFMRNSSYDVYNIDRGIVSNFKPINSKSLEIEDMKKTKSLLDQRENKKHSLLARVVSVLNDNIIFITEHKKKLLDCKAGKLDGVIYANGDVSLCEFTKPFCNLKDFDFNFKSAWNSEEANRMRKKISNCFCTHSCNLMNAMKYDYGSLKKIFEQKI